MQRSLPIEESVLTSMSLESDASRPRDVLVSIGLPVYNGSNYVAEAIESVLTQTYKNFELIISDNASTDSTQEICQKFAKQDDRIRYYRNAKNLGAGANMIAASISRLVHSSNGLRMTILSNRNMSKRP